MLARGNDGESGGAVIASRAKYLGSCLLPSPIEVEATISLYLDMIKIPELDVTISTDQVSNVQIVQGSNLPPQTIVMCGVVGAVIEKDKPYLIIEVGNSSDGMLFKLDDKIVAEKFEREVRKSIKEPPTKENVKQELH